MTPYEKVQAYRAAHPGASISAGVKAVGVSVGGYYHSKPSHKPQPRAKNPGVKAQRRANYQKITVAEPPPPAPEKQMIMVMGTPEQLRAMLKEALL